MDQRPVPRMAEHRGTVSQLDGDHPGCGTRADPCQESVAIGVIRDQERPNPGRDPHVLVRLVKHLEVPDLAGNRMVAFRGDENPLVSLVGR